MTELGRLLSCHFAPPHVQTTVRIVGVAVEIGRAMDAGAGRKAAISQSVIAVSDADFSYCEKSPIITILRRSIGAVGYPENLRVPLTTALWVQGGPHIANRGAT